MAVASTGFLMGEYTGEPGVAFETEQIPELVRDQRGGNYVYHHHPHQNPMTPSSSIITTTTVIIPHISPAITIIPVVIAISNHTHHHHCLSRYLQPAVFHCAGKILTQTRDTQEEETATEELPPCYYPVEHFLD